MYFHSVSLPVVRHLGPPLSWPVQDSADIRTYRLDVNEFAKDISSFLTNVAVFKTPALTISGVIWDKYSITLQITGGNPSYKETVSFALTFDNGDYENVNVFVPISSNAAGIPAGSVLVDGQVLTFAGKPVEVRDMPGIPGGAADNDLIVVFRAPDTLGTVAISALPSAAGGGSLKHLTTGANVSGHMALMFDEIGNVVHADPTKPFFAFAGVSTQAALAGDPVGVASSGIVTEPTWDWQPELPLFIAANGLLSQSPPVIGVAQQIAVAINSTSIVVQAYIPITLA